VKNTIEEKKIEMFEELLAFPGPVQQTGNAFRGRCCASCNEGEKRQTGYEIQWKEMITFHDAPFLLFHSQAHVRELEQIRCEVVHPIIAYFYEISKSVFCDYL
jgi:hypothetical protein